MVKLDKEKIINILKAERMAFRTSWRGLAKMIGVSPNCMFRIKNGDITPGGNTLAKILYWTQKNIESFITREDL